MRFTEPQPIGYAFWSSWRGWALLAAVGGSAWLSGCKTPMPAPAPAPSTRPAPAPAPSGQAARTPAEFRLLAARRLVEANPSMIYLEDAPEPLLAIPVLEAELDADGRILKINVLRYPSQAKDTTQLAIDAMKRAAPYGDMRRLPKPWRYTEAFLFDDNRRFKPRTLDE